MHICASALQDVGRKWDTQVVHGLQEAVDSLRGKKAEAPKTSSAATDKPQPGQGKPPAAAGSAPAPAFPVAAPPRKPLELDLSQDAAAAPKSPKDTDLQAAAVVTPKSFSTAVGDVSRSAAAGTAKQAPAGQVLDLNQVTDDKKDAGVGATVSSSDALEAASTILAATGLLEGDTVLQATEAAAAADGGRPTGQTARRTEAAAAGAPVVITPEVAAVLHAATDGLLSPLSVGGGKASASAGSQSQSAHPTQPAQLTTQPTPTTSTVGADTSVQQRQQEVVAAAAAAAAVLTPGSMVSSSGSVVPEGLSVAVHGRDLSPAGLILHAVKSLGGEDPDYASFKQR